MQLYITQLIEDLTEAAKTKLEAPDYKLLNPNNPALKAGLDYLVAWECAPYLTYFEVFGIPNEAFPPSEILNEDQAKQVVEAIVHLFELNNIEVGFPERLPSYQVLYRELRKEWQEKTMRIMPKDEMQGIDFCHYNGETCPWEMNFCTCKDEEWYNSDDTMDSFSKNDDDLPF